jgi:peroxiredoxin Q/BCP
LARLRDEYDLFRTRGAEILAVGPDDQPAFRDYWKNHRLPFAGLPDPEHRVSGLYKQQVRLFKLGRMPLVCVVDRDGLIRYAHYGNDMSDIPDNQTLLRVLDQINASSS